MHQKETLATVNWLLQLLSLQLMFTQFSAAAIATNRCPDGYKRRILWIRGKQAREVCCRFVECNPGYYVRTCDEDYGWDRCEKCPDKTFIFDKTNSTNAHPCPKFECPPHMRQVNYFPLGSCHQPCLCDTSKMYYLKNDQRDHCNCLLYEGSCPAWQVLSLLGKCVSPRDAELIEEKTKPKNPVTFPPSFVNPGAAENSKSKNTDSKSSLSTTSCVLISIVLVAAFIALIAFLYLRFYRQKNHNTHGTERVILPAVNRPVANVHPHARNENKVTATVTISAQPVNVNHYLTAPASLVTSLANSHVETEASPSVPNNPGTWPSPDTEQPLNYVDLSPCHLYQSIRRQQPIDGSPDIAASQPLLHNVEHLYPSLPPSTNLLFSRCSSQDSEIDDDNTNVKSTS
ncbi:uncharacterized protein [Mytilus edulis]|uniref:uncharacterized protein isoform X1 n=1 Tax=Mytilus edulis TaxID=6550 RepID=UPI0039EE5ADE